MDTAQWPQEIVVKPMEEIVPNTCSRPSLERRVRPRKEQALNCPRCNSTNTKFCYCNNYSLSQPRYFCKTCRRYWTEGGSLRNIPVGGGSRKNKRSSSSSSSSSSVAAAASSKKLPDLVPPPSSQSASQNPKIHEGQDLNLAFPSHDFKTISELIQVPNFDNNNKNHMQPSSSSASSSHLSALELLTGISSSRGLNSFMSRPISDPSTIYSSGFSLQEFKPTMNFSLDNNNKNHMQPFSSSTSSSHLSALELLTGISSSRGLNSFMPMPISDPSTIYSSGFSLQEFKPTINFSLDHGLGSLQGVQETSGRLLFPFEDLKQVSSTSDMEQNTEQRDSTGYWNGVLGGGSW